MQVVPPAGIMSIGAYLRANGVPVELVDIQVDFGFGMTEEAERTVRGRVTAYLERRGNSISWIGLSLLSNHEDGIRIAMEIREALPDVPVVLGGYFPTTCHESLLRSHPFISAVVLGDGEAAALAISRQRDRGGPFPDASIPGLAWLGPGGRIRRTPRVLSPLADLPAPDMDLLHNPLRYPVWGLTTSRGCPHSCAYCLEACMRPYSAYPLDRVRRQLEQLKALDPGKPVYIPDPFFAFNPERTPALCGLLGSYGFRYALMTRLDSASPEFLAALRLAGVAVLVFGLESASAGTLVRMGKVKTASAAKRYLRRTAAAVGFCFANDITAVMSIMLGYPGDGEREAGETLDFIRSMRGLYTESGSKAGFLAGAQMTSVFRGSPLEARLDAGACPGVILRDSGREGERIVASPSPGMDADSLGRAWERIRETGVESSPLFLRRLSAISFSPALFMASHPESMDAEGVVTLGQP